jgi:hypothetical protein
MPLKPKALSLKRKASVVIVEGYEMKEFKIKFSKDNLQM